MNKSITIPEIKEISYDTSLWGDQASAWNESSSFFVELHKRPDRQEQVNYFLRYTKEHHLLPSTGGTTLDIGCAVGDYALGLAHQGYQATGLDLSKGMLEGARSLAMAEQVPLTLIAAPWSEDTRQTLQWNQTFDFVYSIFCPVMFDPENIRAMSRTSHGKYLWVAFSNRQDTIVDALTNHFYGPDSFDWQAAIDTSLQTIHDIGHQVEVTYRTIPETESFTPEEAVDYFSLRLHHESYGSLENFKAELPNLLKPYMIDNKVINTTSDTMAWVSWSA